MLGTNAAYLSQFNVLQTYSYAGLPITLDWIGMQAMQGGVGNIVVGWYQWDPFFNMMIRHGGHSLSVIGLQKSSNLSNPLVTFHDPNTDPNGEGMAIQSPVRDDQYEVIDTPWLYGTIDDPNLFTIFGSLPFVKGLGGAIDGSLFAVPVFGFTSDPANLTLSEYHPYNLTATELPPAKHFTAQGTGKLISVALDPVRSSRYYIKRGENRVWDLDSRSGQAQVFAEVVGPKQVIVGGKLLTRYVLTHHALLSYDNDHRLQARTLLSIPLDQVAFDSANNRILGISRERKRLFAYDADSLRLANIYALPAVQFPEGDLSLSVNPATSELLLHSDHSDKVWKVTASLNGDVRVSRIRLQKTDDRAVGFNVDDVGNLYTTVAGKIQVYTPTGEIFRQSRFNGLASGRFLEISRSFSNFDPAIHTGPAFQDIPPTDRIGR